MSDALMEWRVTFGQQYAQERHPTFARAHPDGWVTILATSEPGARGKVFGWLGQRWAFIYAMGPARDVSIWSDDGDRIDWPETFPRGELHRVSS